MMNLNLSIIFSKLGNVSFKFVQILFQDSIDDHLTWSYPLHLLRIVKETLLHTFAVVLLKLTFQRYFLIAQLDFKKQNSVVVLFFY